MASAGRASTPGSARARHSKNTGGRTWSAKDKAGQPQHQLTEVYDFSDYSDVLSVGKLSENERDEELCESFEPPLHSTAIYTDEAQLSGHGRSFVPSPPPGKEAGGSLNTYEIEESENEFVKISAKKPRRKPRPIREGSESGNERGVTMEGELAEKISGQQQEDTSSSELPGQSAELDTPKRIGPPSAKSSVDREAPATESHLKTQKKKMFYGKRKKSGHEVTDSGVSDSAHIWCLKGKKSSDIMELDVVLSAFEETIPEYKQNIESKMCKEAVSQFHSALKEELIRTLTGAQKLKSLKRRNAKMVSDMEKKRQRLIEVQDELLWLEPQLKQLQRRCDELEERRSSLRHAACFLPNLKQLCQDYSALRQSQPGPEEAYDSSSLPALLVKGRTLLGAQSHLQNINYQLERLLDQE